MTLLCSCTSPAIVESDAPRLAAAPEPDIGCQSAPQEALDLGAIRQRRDRCEPPRTFECEKRRGRSAEVTRVRLIVLDDGAFVSTTTGVLGASHGAFAHSHRTCRRVTREQADVVAAMFGEARTIDACRSTIQHEGDDTFSMGGIASITLRSQAMFCVDALVTHEPCTVMIGDAPAEQIANVCAALFELADERRE